MNKLFLIFIFIILGSFLHAETYILPTSQGDKELFIPDDPEDLRDAYIDMASLYLEERFDLEVSIAQVDSLLGIHEDYKSYYSKLESTTQKLIKELSKDHTDLFRLYLSGHYRYDILKPSYNIGVGVDVQIFEALMIGIFYEVPTSFGITVTGRLY